MYMYFGKLIIPEALVRSWGVKYGSAWFWGHPMRLRTGGS